MQSATVALMQAETESSLSYAPFFTSIGITSLPTRIYSSYIVNGFHTLFLDM